MAGSVIADDRPRIRCSQGVDVSSRIQAIYEAASTGPRMADRGLVGVSGPNADIVRSLPYLRKRSRHAVRNNPYASKAKETLVSSLVGKGITAKFPDDRVQRLWDIWVSQCDADGMSNFYALQALAAGGQFESGEVLVRRRQRRPGDGLVVPLQLQLQEGDHLDEGFSQQGQNPIVTGIQFNAWGGRESYHLWRDHPADIARGLVNARVKVPAADVLHLYRVLRPGQLRGLPELTPVLFRLYQIDEMQDATLQTQKTAALFAWIIKRDPNAGVTDDSTIDGGQASASDDPDQIQKIIAGAAHYLKDGESIEFSTPGNIGTGYAQWLKTELLAVAAGLNITYEQLTGDLNGVTYSSIRAALIEFRRRIEHLQLHFLIHRFCQPIAMWFLESVVLNGQVDLPDFWRNPWDHLPKWKPPKWEWVDPLKDVMADALEVRSGFASRKDKAAERGRDIDELNEQLLEEQAMELVLDSNPAKVSKTGIQQTALAAMGAGDG